MANVFSSGAAFGGSAALALPRPDRLDVFAPTVEAKSGLATVAVGLLIASFGAASATDPILPSTLPIDLAATDATAPVRLDTATVDPVVQPASAPTIVSVAPWSAPDVPRASEPARAAVPQAAGRHSVTSVEALARPVLPVRTVAPFAAPAIADAPDSARITPEPAELPVVAALAEPADLPPAPDLTVDAAVGTAVGAPRQTADGVEFTVNARFNDQAAGRLPLLLEGGTAGDTSRVSDNISVRLDDLVNLLSARISPDVLAWMKSSKQMASYVTLNDLRAHGIAVAFDDHDRLVLKSM